MNHYEAENECSCFEKNIFLFIDRNLSEELFSKMEKHISQCRDCSKLFSDTVEILYGSKIDIPEITDDKFDLMVSNATKLSQPGFMTGILAEQKQKKIFYWKLAFTTILLFASITISLLSTRSNPVKKVSKDLLDWEGNKIETELKTIDQSIKSLNGEDWNIELTKIDNSLNNLEKSADKYSFN